MWEQRRLLDLSGLNSPWSGCEMSFGNSFGPLLYFSGIDILQGRERCSDGTLRSKCQVSVKEKGSIHYN